MKSTTTSICFKPQKTEYWSSFIFFLAFSIKQVFFFLYLLWCFVHLMFLLFTGLNWRVQTHASDIFRSSYVSFVDILFFWLSQANRYGSFYIYWYLSNSCLDLMFQVFKCLKWRVQPHPSVLNCKKPSIGRALYFFLAFSIKQIFFFLYLLWFSVHLMFLLFTGLN